MRDPQQRLDRDVGRFVEVDPALSMRMSLHLT
jgi:hypothetical protein